eukprot:maker-scaffold_43-snap-gene-1.31-mRNA-1 protein AED:0.00 eAED:0.00 QI:116/1/1/1/0/0/3/16/627
MVAPLETEANIEKYLKGRRLRKEVQVIRDSKQFCIVKAYSSGGGKTVLVSATLEQSSPYHNVSPIFEIFIRDGYPMSHFVIRKISPPLFHPNFDETGNYPLKKYANPYQIKISFTKLLLHLYELLHEPDFREENIHNFHAAQLVQKNYPAFLYIVTERMRHGVHGFAKTSEIWKHARHFLENLKSKRENGTNLLKFIPTDKDDPATDGFLYLEVLGTQDQEFILSVREDGKYISVSSLIFDNRFYHFDDSKKEFIVRGGDKFALFFRNLKMRISGLSERVLLIRSMEEALVSESWLIPYHNQPIDLSEQYRFVARETDYWKTSPQYTGSEIIRAPFWGISFNQFAALLVSTGFLSSEDSDLWNKHWSWDDVVPGTEDISVYDFVPKYVWPMTKQHGMGYSLMVNREKPMRVEVIISHAWNEGILEFFFSLQDALYTSNYDHAFNQGLFICFLALYQYDGSEQDKKPPGPSIGKQLGKDILKSPFVEVLYQFKVDPTLRVTPYNRYLLENTLENRNLEHLSQMAEYYGKSSSLTRVDCGRMIAIPNRHCNIYTRMWCVLELFMSVSLGVPTIVSASGNDILLDSNVALSEAKCGTETDTDLIRTAIEKLGGFDDAAVVLKQFDLLGRK